MSLIHWWPLNGNLNDIGIKSSLLTMNNVPSTQYINGKIGQCYNFDGSAWGQASNVSVGTDCTICCWAKTSSTAATMLWGMQCTGSDYMNLYNSWRICLNIGDSEDNPFRDSSNNDISQIHDDLWHHFVVVFKGSEKAKLYIDGVYRGQAVTYRNPTMNNQNFTIGTWNYSSHGYYWNGGINDVRIYDHALSIKEIKETSKGLVLHYNFEDAYAEGTTNLNSANWNPYSSYWTISSQTVNEITLVSQGTSHGTVAIYNESVRGQLSANTTYTISGYLYRDGAPYKCTDSTLTPYDGWITSKFESKDDGFFSYTGYFTSPTSDVWIIHTPLFGAPESGVVCKIKNMQWEQKDHATPYVNGTRPNGIIYDNSGYGYNGTQTGSLQILEDSASGKYSIFSPPGANYVERQNIPLDCFNATQEFTITCWLKVLAYNPSGDWNTIFRLAANNNTDTQLHMCYNSSGQVILSQYSDDPIFDSHITLNTWTHLTWVHYKEGSSIKCKYYVNGSLIGTGTYDGALNIQANPRLTLFYDSIRGYYGSSSYLGDFKIYATALSAEDVLAEYNRKASIDKTGKLFANYIKEHETTNNLIEKTTFNIEKGTNFRTWSYLGACTEATYNANWPNDTDISLSAYVQSNCQVTQTSQGIRIYSEANATNDATWGGLVFSPMVYSRCLIKGHHYRISWHVKGHSSRQMTDVYWTNNVGWGQYPDAEPTVHKTCLPPANFDGEMDCFYDFSIEDDVFKTTTSDVHSGFEPNTSYLAYASFKIGFTYQETGSMGTDIYITNLKMYDLTTGDVYKIEKNGIVKTTEAVSGRRDSARLHSDGVIDVTDITEY